jgi:hypothetical protein
LKTRTRTLAATIAATLALILGAAPASAHVVGSSSPLVGTPVFLAYFWYCPVTGGQLSEIPGGHAVSYSASTLSVASSTSACTSSSAVNVSSVRVTGKVLRDNGGGLTACGADFDTSAANFWYAVNASTRDCGTGCYEIFINIGSVYNSGAPSINYSRTLFFTTYHCT